MPRIVTWYEKLQYVRPTYDKHFNFLTPEGIKYIETSAHNAEAMEAKIDVLASELWFCQHMTNYISNLIKVQLEDVKEDP